MNPLVVSFLLSVIAYAATTRAIPLLSPVFIRKGRFGKDLLKKDQPVTAESIGAVVGIICFVALFLFIPVPFMDWVSSGKYIQGQHPEFPFFQFAQYLGGLLALMSMLFLGFADDVLDIPWRVKIFIPIISSMPLLMVYFVTIGRTEVIVPSPIHFLFQSHLIDLGIFYYVYLCMLTTFCTNAINILAGINGVEGGQSLIIAISIALNDLIQSYIRHVKPEAHLNSLYILMPFIGVTLGYLKHNWYPARAFGGDTYCYFAGMTFAVVGILGNFSKTILLFMIPQIFNFVFSLPQLFHLVECPRHRMPKYNSKTGLIEASSFEMTSKTKPIGRLIVRVFSWMGLVTVTKKSQDCEIISNLTLINLLLVKFGPMKESSTAKTVMMVQILCSVIGFAIRYGVVHFFYESA